MSTWKVRYETHLSASQSQESQDPWLFKPHEHPRRSPGSQAAAGKGQEAPDRFRLIPDRLPYNHRLTITSCGTHTLRGVARFRKIDRLLRKSEFHRVKLHGKNYHTSHFIISRVPNELRRPRLGVVVTKRIGRAVKRNRVKRLLREFFRLHQGVMPPEDIVIVAKKGSPYLTFAEVTAELTPRLACPRPAETNV